MTDVYFEISDDETTNFTTDKNKTFYKQKAWMHLAHEPHPIPVSLFLGQENKPYAKGKYEPTSHSYYADKFSSPAFNPRLIPLKAEPVRKAS